VKAFDRVLQRWRVAKARRYIPAGARLLDIGCADGTLLRTLGASLRSGVGVDPSLHERSEHGGVVLLPGRFPESVPEGEAFDVITLLAVLEHVPRADQPDWARACAERLAPGGLVVVTVPSHFVDPILFVLKSLRIIDGMGIEEHYGFRGSMTEPLFANAGFRLVRHQRFQGGLNHLFVFQKTPA